jgi:hypothetical protein
MRAGGDSVREPVLDEHRDRLLAQREGVGPDRQPSDDQRQHVGVPDENSVELQRVASRRVLPSARRAGELVLLGGGQRFGEDMATT